MLTFLKDMTLTLGRYTNWRWCFQQCQWIFVTYYCIYLNPKKKRLLCSIGVWCFMFGHSLLPVRSGGRLLLGGVVCATVVVDRNIRTPYSRDLSWRVTWFVWNLGLSVEEAAFYLGTSTWIALSSPCRDTKIKLNLFSCEAPIKRCMIVDYTDDSLNTLSFDHQLSCAIIDYHQLSFTLNMFKIFMMVDDSFSRLTMCMTDDDSSGENELANYHKLSCAV